MSSVFFNKGENCIAAGRLFVEESIHDEFLERIVSSVVLSWLWFCQIGVGVGWGGVEVFEGGAVTGCLSSDLEI